MATANHDIQSYPVRSVPLSRPFVWLMEGWDDMLHHALGLQDRTWQSLYHFTIGTPVDDPRLRSAPPYGEARTAS